MDGPVVCYGASGYTGRLVVQALVDRGVEVALAGRSREKLRRVRDDLDLQAEVRPARVDDEAGLDAILADAAAVVNTAGPFLSVGDGVARAAVRTGTPYVDSTGEQLFAKRLADRLGDRAAEAGVPLVPMLAFEYAPGDLLAALLLSGRPARRLDVCYKIDHGVATEGTRRSVLEVATRTGYRWVQGGPVELVPAEETRTVRLDDRDLSAYAFPGGEVLTVPRHEDVDSVETYMVAHPDTIRWLKRLGPLARTLVRGPVRGLVSDLMTWDHQDPTVDERSEAVGRVVLEAAFDDGDPERYGFACRDPYALTAELLAEGATRLADDPSPGGVVAPAEAFESEGFLEAIRKRHAGMAWGPDGPPEI